VLCQVMEAAKQRYAADERVQLDTLADHFVSVFRDAELPFNKLLAEQPLPKVRPCTSCLTSKACLSLQLPSAVNRCNGKCTGVHAMPRTSSDGCRLPKRLQMLCRRTLPRLC
jgi:hypothetical protein